MRAGRGIVLNIYKKNKKSSKMDVYFSQISYHETDLFIYYGCGFKTKSFLYISRIPKTELLSVVFYVSTKNN